MRAPTQLLLGPRGPGRGSNQPALPFLPFELEAFSRKVRPQRGQIKLAKKQKRKVRPHGAKRKVRHHGASPRIGSHRAKRSRFARVWRVRPKEGQAACGGSGLKRVRPQSRSKAPPAMWMPLPRQSPARLHPDSARRRRRRFAPTPAPSNNQ